VYDLNVQMIGQVRDGSVGAFLPETRSRAAREAAKRVDRYAAATSHVEEVALPPTGRTHESPSEVGR
jgi:hypothetical protein